MLEVSFVGGGGGLGGLGLMRKKSMQHLHGLEQHGDCVHSDISLLQMYVKGQVVRSMSILSSTTRK